MKRMVVDISNLFWRTVAAQQRYGPADAKESAGFGLHTSLMSLRKNWNIVKPDHMAIVFEGRANWRKEYTKSEQCVSKRLYKGNRVVDPTMAILAEVIKSFEEMARLHSNITCLSHPRLEGDDLISGYAHYFAAQGDEVTVLSGDKDFVQLLGDPNIKLLNPDESKYRTLLDVCGIDDAGYFIFEKCFRGDAGDNVLTAYPRVRKASLQKAYGIVDNKFVPEKADAFELAKIMNHEWEFMDPETGDKRMMSTKALFEENQLLMDLTKQPEEIRGLIKDTIEHESSNHGAFNFFQFTRFLGKHDLKAIAERAQDFVAMLSGRHPASVERKVESEVVKKVAQRFGGLEM